MDVGNLYCPCVYEGATLKGLNVESASQQSLFPPALQQTAEDPAVQQHDLVDSCLKRQQPWLQRGSLALQCLLPPSSLQGPKAQASSCELGLGFCSAQQLLLHMHRQRLQAATKSCWRITCIAWIGALVQWCCKSQMSSWLQSEHIFPLWSCGLVALQRQRVERERRTWMLCLSASGCPACSLDCYKRIYMLKMFLNREIPISFANLARHPWYDWCVLTVVFTTFPALIFRFGTAPAPPGNVGEMNRHAKVPAALSSQPGANTTLYSSQTWLLGCLLLFDWEWAGKFWGQRTVVGIKMGALNRSEIVWWTKVWEVEKVEWGKEKKCWRKIYNGLISLKIMWWSQSQTTDTFPSDDFWQIKPQNLRCHTA